MLVTVGGVILALFVGAQVMNRIDVDNKAREAAEEGANLGGTSNSQREMYDILCPQGPDTASTPGIDCSNVPN